MKKIITLILTFILSISALAIVDFQGVNWRDEKSAIEPMFKNLKEEPSFKASTQIFSVPAIDPHIKDYKFYFKDKQLYMIRITFNNQVVGREQIKTVYKKLTRTLGNPIARKQIDKKVDSLKLQGNYIKFAPDIDTAVYYIGLDTIDTDNNMIDSNLYLDYTDSRLNEDPEI